MARLPARDIEAGGLRFAVEYRRFGSDRGPTPSPGAWAIWK